eukprot:CAMPEP_0113316076 /NCGR_PEP_ID=MMETSP0010_2-20120614/11482_1 /TAXON_ID=216773 ORGANISM="Corethron hystrix, Strain 308" /NCGR_SAMPLE_ID=MMETSP0010_2 /ASSEMBLY_ACC=CAM_ASM_000155 /LENGTH=224 /DNA_ID=CAMNT_0000172691 /DNA_START=97 /DNA_END=772 /DNA_ORIENTATION=- /assembly_acc=CAM_ASM_000155
MAEQLIHLALYKSWSGVASNFDLQGTQQVFEEQPQIDSKSLIAGSWSKIVTSHFSMPNFKLFDKVDVPMMEEFMNVDLSMLNGALDAIVHKLTFSAEWETPFDRSNKVEFNDGNTYNFMQTTVYQASSFDSPQLKMVTIPFKSLNENEKIVIDFIVPQRESNYINLGHHGTWVADSVTNAQTVITIPKIKFQFETQLDLFPDKGLKAIQKVDVEWDEKEQKVKQ